MRFEEHGHAVWACDHLWSTIDRDGVDSPKGLDIVEAAELFQQDGGENVALCGGCHARPSHLIMSQRLILLTPLDGSFERRRLLSTEEIKDNG